MLGILISRGLRKQTGILSSTLGRPPVNCYAGRWWKELWLNGSGDVCDCRIWCKYPVTRIERRDNKTA